MAQVSLVVSAFMLKYGSVFGQLATLDRYLDRWYA